MNNLRGAKIIYQESKATQPSHLYFLQKDANNFDIIVTSESGVKRRLNSSVDLSNFYTKTETFSQTEINNLLSTKQNNLGYTPENIANKSNSYTISSSTTYASTKALVDGLATKLNKGTYTGTAQDLFINDENLLQNLRSEEFARYYADQGLENSKQNKLESVSGNTGIGKTDASATEKIDVKGNVKADGFKTPGGTANQSLTANGGTVDLNTKADLVGGKVPKAQSQPSTMVMNNSTYIITFTDATGAVQTIDLPLESLFQDANYDETTKSLIVTLQDGTNRTIPLTDLVDLPEIVLSTANPAVTPTTGQKVYFNTSLGKVWFNTGGTWSGGYSLINTITTAVTSTTTVGAINAGDIIPTGTTIQELTELLLNKTFYPTFANPTFNLTNNAGLREVGSSFNVTLTFNFNRGQILGKLDNGIWNPTMLQDYRAGIATSYLLNGVSGSNNSASFNVTTILGNNNLSGSVTYGIGVQPKDSKNNNYDNPLPSGTSPVQSTSFEGIYPYFYYKSTSPITPAIMQSAIANGQATKVVASSTGTITIPFLPSGEYIAVAYPATSTTKTKWYINALDNGDIPGGILGGTNTLPCNSPTGLWNNVNFKIHVSAGVLTQYEAVQLKNS